MVRHRKYGRKLNRRRYKSVVPLATRKYVKAIVNKTEETKMWLSNWVELNVRQSTLLWAAPLQALRQGTQSTERVGKTIHVNNVLFKGIITGAPNLYETYIRMVIFEADKEAQSFGYVAGAENHSWTNDTSKTLENKLFLNPGGGNIYAYVNNAKAKVISDTTIKIHKDVMQNTQTPCRPFVMSAKLNKDITYTDNASYSAPLGRQLYYAVSAYSYGIGLGTDLCSLAGTFMVTFKDS